MYRSKAQRFLLAWRKKELQTPRPLSLFFIGDAQCMCLCVCRCACWYEHGEAREGCQGFCSTAFHILPLRRCHSLSQELGWHPGSPVPTSITHGFQVCTAILRFLCGSWRFEPRFPCWHSKNSYPLSHLTSPQVSFILILKLGEI